MRKGQRKVNITGSASCISLLLLAFLLVNPLIGNSASALESEEYETSPQVTTISDVNISFSPTSGSASLTPVTEEGAKARTSVKANVSISNSGGYSVYLSSKTPGLVGKNSGEMIAGIDGSSTFDNLQTNTWGYAVTEEEELSEVALYKSMSQGQGDLLATGSERSVSYNFLLSFAAKIGNTKPADTYENEVTLSVVSSPLEISNVFGIETMQEMTSKICENVPTPAAFTEAGEINADVPTAQLIDSRDGKSYWVAKLADGNCWMTQNLALELSSTTALTPKDSDVSTDWAPEFNTLIAWSPLDQKEYIGTRSWDNGGYVLKVPTYTAQTCSNSTSLQDGFTSDACLNIVQDVSDGWVASADTNFFGPGATLDAITKTYDAHYSLGNKYQWNAAAAGSGGDIVSTSVTESGMVEATSSICPKGWRLPPSGGTGDYEPFLRDASIAKLLSIYGWNGQNSLSTNTAALAPLYFIMSGTGSGSTNAYTSAIGGGGYYWTATASTNANTSYYVYLTSATDIEPSSLHASGNYRYRGNSVRCVAR